MDVSRAEGGWEKRRRDNLKKLEIKREVSLSPTPHFYFYLPPRMYLCETQREAAD